MASSSATAGRGEYSLLRFPFFFYFFLFIVELVAVFPALPLADSLSLDFHHRFSDRVRHWAEERGGVSSARWPERGTAEYYATLAYHDRVRQGRFLAEGSADTFADGNTTYQLDDLGYLYYAFVTLGTPNVSFLMALDTGSDLTWVPCDCIQCAPTSSPSYGGGQNLVFNTYNPSESTTSQNVLCSNSLCNSLQSSCDEANSICPYLVQYADANYTSTSGFLVEDVLYLITEDATPQIIETPVVFGCGENQTGSFLQSGAPDGLFALGSANISVPSVLASNGVVSNSFSMCFGDDNTGRINFGDQGSTDQQETPLVSSGVNTLYNILITGMQVGINYINMSFNAIIDSGTSFTTLSDPMYTYLTQSFDSQIQTQRIANNSDIPFDYCYGLSPTQTSVVIPDINLTTDGGSNFPINDPIIGISLQQNQNAFCLAVTKANGLINIIGQNFLTGLRVVFNSENQILGWENFDCYKTGGNNNSTVSVSSSPPAASPAETQPGKNNTAVESAGRPYSSHHSLDASSVSSLQSPTSLAILLLLCLIN